MPMESLTPDDLSCAAFLADACQLIGVFMFIRFGFLAPQQASALSFLPP